MNNLVFHPRHAKIKEKPWEVWSYEKNNIKKNGNNYVGSKFMYASSSVCTSR